MSIEKIKVPTLGESVTEATIAKWLKKEGEAVAIDEPIVELETDKVTMEVNAPATGVLGKIIANEGDTVDVGAELGEINTDSKTSATPEKSEKPASESTPSKVDDESKSGPAGRKALADNNLDESDVKGSGKDGRVTKSDVAAHVASPTPKSVPSAPATPRNTTEREERVRMSKLRQTIAGRLKDAQNTAAILTTFNEVDMTDLMALRSEFKDTFEKKHGTKLGFMSFFTKAVVQALKEFPAVNAEIDGTDIIYKNYYDIGVAVSTPQGLVVPVVRDCDKLSMADIEKAIAGYGTKARDGQITMADMQGGSFTVTNGGVFGSLLSTPILNAPQSGILGMHTIQKRPVVMPNGSIEARQMMYIALSYDHRIVDGREAVSFLVRIKQMLENPARMVMEV